MRDNIILLAFVVILSLFVTCSDDNEIESIGGKDGDISFIIPGIRKAAETYAPIASDDENLLTQLTIYMFNDVSGKLEKIFRADQITIKEEDKTNHSATINLTRRSGKKTFFFVINGEDVSDELKQVIEGVTPMSEFVEIITDKHTQMPKIPLLMSGKTTIDQVETPTEDERKVKIRRRLARFDIENDSDDTNFEIQKIYVSKGNLRTYLFSDASGTPPKRIEIANFTAIDFSTFDDANKGHTPSVFYIYPTTLGAGKTDISFEGKFQGEVRMYNLHLDKDVNIEPNTRYIIKAKKVPINNIEFEITIANWELGSEHITEPETELVKFSSLELNGGEGIVDNGNDSYDITKISKDGIITFTATSYHKEGTTVAVKYNHGAEASWTGLRVNTPTPVLTYGTHYLQKYEIYIPTKANNVKLPIDVDIIVTNATNIDQKKIVTIYSDRYPGSKRLYPVQFDGLYWAPVNVGAVEKSGYIEPAEMGLFYQWGRNNYGSRWKDDSDLVQGPLTTAEGTTGTAKDKFIKNQELLSSGDWTTQINNNFWFGNTQGPCPTGWRVPSQAELQKILTAYNRSDGTVVWEKQYLKIKGTNDNGILYLPATGYRKYDGKWYDQGISGNYWTGTVNSPYVYYMTFDAGKVEMRSNAFRASGFMVRCVR